MDLKYCEFKPKYESEHCEKEGKRLTQNQALQDAFKLAETSSDLPVE